MELDDKLNLENKFESLVVEGHEIRRFKQEGDPHFEYLFYRETHPGVEDFVLVYAGSNENAWQELKWGNGNEN